MFGLLIHNGDGDDALYGNAGGDVLTGGLGHDVFLFGHANANGDTVADFTPGTDSLWFVGYGTSAQGATFTQVDATHWNINAFDGSVHDTLTLTGGPAIQAADYRFL